MTSLKVNKFNTQYGYYSTIIFNLNMEYVSKMSIFGLKRMVKIILEKIFLKANHAGGI